VFNKDTRKFILLDDNIKPSKQYNTSGIVLNAQYTNSEYLTNTELDKEVIFNHKQLTSCDDILKFMPELSNLHPYGRNVYCITSYPYKEAADKYFGETRLETNTRLFNITVNNTVHDSTGKIVGCLGFNI
jgi:hypothetical protein